MLEGGLVRFQRPPSVIIPALASELEERPRVKVRMAREDPSKASFPSTSNRSAASTARAASEGCSFATRSMTSLATSIGSASIGASSRATRLDQVPE